MNVANLCVRNVVFIAADATLRETAIRMCDEHVGALVIVNHSDPPQVLGVVTDSDLALNVLGRAEPVQNLRVGDLVNTAPVAVSGTCGLMEAIAAMGNSGVRRLLVVDEDGAVTGVISSDDLVCALSKELEGLARALRRNIRRGKSQRKVVSTSSEPCPVFPSVGTLALQ